MPVRRNNQRAKGEIGPLLSLWFFLGARCSAIIGRCVCPPPTKYGPVFSRRRFSAATHELPGAKRAPFCGASVVSPWQVACGLGSALCLCSTYRSRGCWGGQILMGSLLTVVIINYDSNPVQAIEAEQIDKPSGTKMSIEQGHLTPQARSGFAACGHDIKSGKEHQSEYAKLPRLRARSRQQARSCRGPATLPSRAS